MQQFCNYRYSLNITQGEVINQTVKQCRIVAANNNLATLKTYFSRHFIFCNALFFSSKFLDEVEKKL